MCGIAGFTAPRSDAARILLAMNAAQHHRGPDRNGTFVDRELALGHTRLSIVDLAGGIQPRIDEITGDALVFNGEIYGHGDIAAGLRRAGVLLRDRSDTEVLFHLIRREGLRRAVDRIDGMFAFAYRDGASGTLHLVRDRFGEKPLYYAIVEGQLVFASEVAALLCHPALGSAGLDRLAAYRYLLFDYLPGDDSGWEGIRKLAPASILSFRNGYCSLRRYWHPSINGSRREKAKEVDAAERLEVLLADSVKRRMVADVPVGVFLSGGIDSSLIAALAAKAAPNVTAFTVKFREGAYDETSYAKEVADHLGLRHELVELADRDYLDALDGIAARLSEPLGDSSILSTFLLCRAARPIIKVSLGGDGADELFAGYPVFAAQRFAPFMARVQPRIAASLRRAARRMPSSDAYLNWQFFFRRFAQGFGAPTARQPFLWMASFDPFQLRSLWRHEARPEACETAAFATVDRHAGEAAPLGGVERLLYQFLHTYLPDDILTKVDRASMFNSLEVRSPFLDRAFAEFACALPTDLKLKGMRRKRILRRVAAAHLPARILKRRKQGFDVPIDALLRTLFRERCSDLLLSTSNPVAGWFERPAIEALLTEHMQARKDHGSRLWTLYMLFSVAANFSAQVGQAGSGSRLEAAARVA
jgi:asparagine synthase (glutamine-hydrolysing)